MPRLLFGAGAQSPGLTFGIGRDTATRMRRLVLGRACGIALGPFTRGRIAGPTACAPWRSPSAR
jgi:hypothetical protein